MTRAKNFTLIELLCVVAVIAILASLLLPGIANAKRISMQANCIANLRSISTWAMLYTHDNDDLGPQASGARTSSESNGYISWDDQLSLYDNRNLSVAQVDAPGLPSSYKEAKVYACPLDKSTFAADAGFAKRTYAINLQISGWWWNRVWRQPSGPVSPESVASPSATTWFSERIRSLWGDRCNALGYAEGSEYRQGEGPASINMWYGPEYTGGTLTNQIGYHPKKHTLPWVFIDGHAEILPRTFQNDNFSAR